MTRSTAALLLLCACAAEPELATSEEAIVAVPNGTGVVARNPQQYAVAIMDAADRDRCAATLIENDLALTVEGCAGRVYDGTLEVAGTTERFKAYRRPWGSDGRIIAVQTRKGLPLIGPNGISTKGFSFDVDPTPLAVGDLVDCFGYGDPRAPQLTSAVFEVADNSDSKTLYLMPFAPDFYTDVLDVGGYCSRDGTGIAAIIAVPGKSASVATVAVPTAPIAASIADLRSVSSFARTHGAVRLRDPASGIFLTHGGVGANQTTRLPDNPDDRSSQAYYLRKVTPPPAGGTEYYRFASATDGRCLRDVGLGIAPFLGSCAANPLPGETFYLDSLGNLSYRLRIPAVGRCLDPALGRPGPCRNDARDLWDMWLAGF